MSDPLLSIAALSAISDRDRAPILRDVSLSVQRGETLGLVGESGAGKSLTGAAIIGLLEPPGRVAGGEIRLEGERIDHLSQAQLRPIRAQPHVWPSWPSFPPMQARASELAVVERRVHGAGGPD